MTSPSRRLRTFAEDLGAVHEEAAREAAHKAQVAEDLEAVAWCNVKAGVCSCVWDLVERDGVVYDEIVVEDPDCSTHTITDRAKSRVIFGAA